MNFIAYRFCKRIHEGPLSLKDADNEQINFVDKLKNLDKGRKQLKKSFFKIT